VGLRTDGGDAAATNGDVDARGSDDGDSGVAGGESGSSLPPVEAGRLQVKWFLSLTGD
jgi:hypothetical protein